jgi:hypothetical protein
MKNDMSRGAGSAFGRKNFDFKKIVEWLGLILKCPICGYKYNLQKTKVLESEQNEISNEARILIHSDCGKCKSSVMFNVEIRGPEVFSVGMVTDLTGNDSNKFQNLKPIAVNEIIGIHQALKEFKGDFISHFTETK